MRLFKLRLFLLPFLLLMLSAHRPEKLAGAMYYGPPNPVWLQVLSRQGDDVTKLLARYFLDEYDCNVTQFFKINNLKEDYRLVANKAYKIPVQEVVYNGKSIRTTLNITDWETAKRIQTYNETARKKGLRADDFIVSKKLWVPWHELNCPQGASVPAVAASVPEKVNINGLDEIGAARGERVFPIFGPGYAKTPVVSNRLKGKVYYIISGHGGPDPGAQGHRAGHTLCEDEYAYDVALRLVRLLVSHGATTYMIVRDPNDGIRDEPFLRCDQDEVVWGDRTIPRDQKERLKQRTDLINALTEKHRKAGVTDQTIIEIHVDSRSRHTKTDVFFYYRPDSEPSQRLAKKFHQTFLQKYLKVRGQQRYNGTVTPRGLFTLRETKAPVAVYIELGNIRNDWDQQRLVIKNNRQALANWLCEALLAR
ncbi:MAG: N-acetylmuramoyl-L-alanine amidase [Saprospiraceae bacterium]|nr:N-acetylmuramoyl-L-alanine amidase [Saprospiraceae bacterium]